MCHIATKRLFSEISTEAFPAVSLPLKGALPSFFQRERLLSCEEGVCAGQHEEGMASGGGEWGGRAWSWTEPGFGDSEDVFCRRDGDKAPGGRLYS